MIAAKELCFIDTNIWLYAFIEGQSSEKSAQARILIKQFDILVSTQVINEICVNLIKKAQVKETQIKSIIDSFYNDYQVVEITKDILLKASQLRERYSLSFWDSGIVACALAGEANILLSEDFTHTMIIDAKLKIINPFLLEAK